MVSVKTDKPIPKELIFECMKEINQLKIDGPIKIGQIIVDNILNTGANLVATKNGQKLTIGSLTGLLI